MGLKYEQAHVNLSVISGTKNTKAVGVRVSYSGFTTIYYFERISNDIIFVNSLPIFPPTLSLEL